MSTTPDASRTMTEAELTELAAEEFDVGRDLETVREQVDGEQRVQFSSDQGWLCMDAKTVAAHGGR